MHIGMSKTFSLLAQESYLAKNAILSSFDLLLKANRYQDKDGFFYSAFFHMTIGLERLLKLAIICNYMLKNNYSTPPKKLLQDHYRHDLITLYKDTLTLTKDYLNKEYSLPHDKSSNMELLCFLSKFGKTSRYFNFDELANATKENSPLEDWWRISNRVYKENTSPARREQAASKLMYSLDNTIYGNRYTSYLDCSGHPMTTFDILHIQYVIQKSAPMIIWKVIEMFSPLHLLLEGISASASKYEIENKIKLMVIPHFEDFFYFFLSDRMDTMRRKKWLDIFNR